MHWQEFSDGLAMAASIAFAVTAVLAIREDSDVDIFGATVLGVITAVGGGTIRDVVIGVPVFWVDDLSYIYVAAVASIAAFYGRRLFLARGVYGSMLYLDGFGAAMFGIQAVGKVWDADAGVPAAPVMLGVTTAIGGGLIRDVLAGRTTLLMKPELYAVPVLLGCLLFAAVLAYLPEFRTPGSLLCIAVSFGIRSAAIRWNWQMPAFTRTHRT